MNISVYIMSCIRQPVAQEVDKKNHVYSLHARKFVDLLRESVCSAKSLYSAEIEQVLV